MKGAKSYETKMITMSIMVYSALPICCPTFPVTLWTVA